MSEMGTCVSFTPAKTLGQVFLAAVESVHRQHEWYWAIYIFRQAQIADNLFSFEWNSHNLKRRIHESGMRAECLKSFFIRVLFAGRGRNWPGSKRIEPPSADVIGIGLRGIGFLERLGFVHVAFRREYETWGRHP